MVGPSLSLIWIANAHRPTGLGGDDGAVVVDTKHLNQLTYNEKDQTAHIGPGNGLGDVNAFLLEYDRLASHGDAPQVGVGGHYTIGGLGRVSRQFGAACDNILSAEVVLADGSLITASPTENTDVFFAIRGAGASFGIVTDFHIRTHPAPGSAIAFTYNVTLGNAQAQADAFKAWQKLVSAPKLPRELSTQFIALPLGISVVTGFYYGSEKDFSALKLDTQLFGIDDAEVSVRVVDKAVAVAHEFSELGLKLFGDVPAHFYSKSLSFSEDTLMSGDAIDAMFKYLGDINLSTLTTPWFVIFDLEGGAINDVAQNSSAYAFRDAIFFLQSYAVDLLGLFQDQSRKFLDGLNEVVLENAGDKDKEFGSYPGYVDPYLDNARDMYWRGNYERLREIKKVRDPDQVFRNPQSVEPAD
jgi:FAD/FMN-containing dehydrogenase